MKKIQKNEEEGKKNKMPSPTKQNLPIIQEEEDYVEYEVVQTGIFKYLLPSKKREEVLGDLAETRQKMERDGVSKRRVQFIMILQKSFILVSLLRLRITDFGKSKKEINK